ncbi:MAG: hypothetical protein R2728_05440 [Chitinophagales bacterium]
MILEVLIGKPPARKGELMVNQYGDERSQQIYSIIDKSRVDAIAIQRTKFNGLCREYYFSDF